MNKYLISIIMPTFNRGYIIENAIQSVLEQTFTNWELIIIDDASNDNTEEIVKRFKDPRIIFIKNEENRGANYSRNRGCMIAKGHFLAFLDSDNVWKNDKLEKQEKVLINSEDNVAFTFCRIEKIDEKNNTCTVPEYELDINSLENVLRKKNIIDMNAVLMKRKILDEVGAFDNDMPRLQDWDIFFRIVVVYKYKATYVPEILDYNIVQADSISKDFHKYQKAIIRFLKKYSKYLGPEEITCHFIYMVKKAQNKVEATIYINEFIDSIDMEFDSLYKILAQQFYLQFQCNQTLFLWKKNMEKSKERTIFIPENKWHDLTIALYGLGQWGNLVYMEMKNRGLNIKYGIDKKVKKFHDVNVIKVNQIPESVNLIIVSVVQEYEEIYCELSRYYSGKILSIGELAADAGIED